MAVSNPPVAHVRQEYARELRISGMTFAEVAEANDPTADPRKPRALYASPAAARKGYLAAEARAHGDVASSAVPASERRALLNDRMELLVQRLMPKAMSGDSDALREIRLLTSVQVSLYGLGLRPGQAPPDLVGEGDTVDDIARKRDERLARARGAASADPASSG